MKVFLRVLMHVQLHAGVVTAAVNGLLSGHGVGTNKHDAHKGVAARRAMSLFVELRHNAMSIHVTSVH